MYECVICLSLNHNARLHCQKCGTVPAMYSPLAVPVSYISGSDLGFRPVVAAKGCDRIERHHAARINLRTVPLDYYAE
jgi:hypothetical protein